MESDETESMMLFPGDRAIEEYAQYEVKVSGAIIRAFKEKYGRKPSKFELPELLRPALVPFGYIPRRSRNGIPGKASLDSVADIVKKHPQLHISGGKVVKNGKMSDADYRETVEEFERRGFRLVPAKKMSDGTWKPSYFVPEGAEA